jgi:hypothetical protein
MYKYEGLAHGPFIKKKNTRGLIFCVSIMFFYNLNSKIKILKKILRFHLYYIFTYKNYLFVIFIFYINQQIIKLTSKN